MELTQTLYGYLRKHVTSTFRNTGTSTYIAGTSGKSVRVPQVTFCELLSETSSKAVVDHQVGLQSSKNSLGITLFGLRISKRGTECQQKWVVGHHNGTQDENCSYEKSRFAFYHASLKGLYGDICCYLTGEISLCVCVSFSNCQVSIAFLVNFHKDRVVFRSYLSIR